jgi:hypothetical protein
VHDLKSFETRMPPPLPAIEIVNLLGVCTIELWMWKRLEGSSQVVEVGPAGQRNVGVAKSLVAAFHLCRVRNGPCGRSHTKPRLPEVIIKDDVCGGWGRRVEIREP